MMSGGSKRKNSTTQLTEELLDVNAKYIIQAEEIGHGHYGVVHRCTNRVTKEQFAIKTIKKGKVNRLELLVREINILKTVDHPGIIKLVDVYEDDACLHLVTELCTGGELFDHIIAKTESDEGHYSERDTAKLVHRILSAIEYCHNEHHICHRDLKPENFLFKSKGSEDDLKIIDFGLSRFEDNHATHMTTRVGTPYYIAPEVLTKKYDKACDLWSIGVIMYILLCGYPPFYGDNDHEIFRSIQKGEFRFLSPEWDTISDEAKHLISQLLLKDTTRRLTASQALVHPWFDLVMDGADTEANVSINKVRINHRLKRFVGSNAIKKLALNVIAHNVEEEDIGHLRKIFHSLDVDGNGEITVEELQLAVASEGMLELQEEVVALLAGVDTNGNSSLDYQEFLAATIERRVFTQERYMKQAFDHFDLEGKGHINVEDLKKAFGIDDAEAARKHLADLDLNGDGLISFSEFKDCLRR
ncbi:unnamed protein product [Chrysoparadoxa australica]